MKIFNTNELANRNNEGYVFSPFFDDIFGFTPSEEKRFNKMMKTDVTEDEKGYNFSIELAGFKKEEISLDLKNGYLTVTAEHTENNNEKKKFIRRERSYESCQRSFYIGDNVTEEDVSAEYDNGILKVVVNKKEEKLPENKKILIK